MENLAYYSSNGRIRQLIIFDTESIDGDGEQVVTDKLKQKYDSFIKKLNEERTAGSEITVWVFYEAGKGTLVIPNCGNGLINFIQAQGAVGTVWTQDMMHVVKGQEGILLLLEFSMGGSLLEKIKTDIPVIAGKVKSVGFNNNLPLGGDYARVRSLNGTYANDYGIDGASIGQNVCVPAPTQLGINPDRYFTLKWEQITRPGGEAVKQEFFHLDLYMTFVGQDIGSKTNIILLPHFIYERLIPSPEFCEIEKKIWSFPTELMNLGMNEDISFIFIPLIRMSSAVVLSYNNCIVENYQIHGKRKIRIYFPNYKDKVRAVIKQAFSGDEASNKISPDELRSDLATAYTTYFPEKDNPLISVDFQLKFDFESSTLSLIDSLDFEKIFTETANEIIDKAEAEISQKLNAWDIKVSFVDLFCDYFAKRHGSLHCLTKVIERDCQP
jgi:hypothetical protein